MNFFLPEDAQVEDIVEYCDREQEIENIDDKRTILDLICKGKDGTHYIVEVQRRYYRDNFKRLIFYASRKYATQIRPSNEYDILRPIYVLNILDYNLEHEDESQWDENHLISHYTFIEERTHEVIAVPTIMITFVEMPRFTKPAEECKSELDCLLYWFKHGGELNMIPEIIKRSPYTSRLADASEFASMTEVQRIRYDSEMINELDRQYQLKEERRMGREEGREKGRDEKALEIALKMKKRGYALEDIAEDTGLTVEEVKDL